MGFVIFRHSNLEGLKELVVLGRVLLCGFRPLEMASRSTITLTIFKTIDGQLQPGLFLLVHQNASACCPAISWLQQRASSR